MKQFVDSYLWSKTYLYYNHHLCSQYSDSPSTAMWVSDCCLLSSEHYFSYIMAGIRYILMMMMSALRLTNTLSRILSTLSWFRGIQSLILLLNTASLVEKQQILLYSLYLTRMVLEPTIFYSRGEYTNHYTTKVAYDWLIN